MSDFSVFMLHATTLFGLVFDLHFGFHMQVLPSPRISASWYRGSRGSLFYLHVNLTHEFSES